MTEIITTIENQIRIANESIAAYEKEINERQFEIARISAYVAGLSDALELIQGDG